MASSKFYSAESSGRMGAPAGGSGGVGAPPAAAAVEAPGTAAGPVEREAPPKLTASALQHLQPSLPSPALAAFEARELPEGLPSAKQGGAYWGKVSAVGVGWSPGFSVFVFYFFIFWLWPSRLVDLSPLFGGHVFGHTFGTLTSQTMDHFCVALCSHPALYLLRVGDTTPRACILSDSDYRFHRLAG